MRHEQFETFKTSFRILFTTIAVFSLASLTSCDDDDDPVKEDVPELVTEVTLTFTPVGGGSAVVVKATDPDGEGVQDLVVDGPINLDIATSYTLTIDLINGLASPTSDEYDITAEVEEEADEHMFFFAWTDGVFEDPAGNGNVDSREGDVNYGDEDENGFPLGLTTTWTTGATNSSGTFRLMLKHQPDLKSATSTSADGESDIDIVFPINVE